MSRFGVKNVEMSTEKIVVPHGTYTTNGTVIVEGDASALSYWALHIFLHGGTLTIDNLGTSTHQGDYKFLDILTEM